MAGIEGPTDGTASAFISSLFGHVEPTRPPEPNGLAENSLLQQLGAQVPGLFDVLQSQDVTNAAAKPDQAEGAGDSGGMQGLVDGFMRSGSLTDGLVEQPSAPQTVPALQGDPNKLSPGGSKELLDILSAHVSASASTGRDVSLEDLIASGQVSAETLLTLIESLRTILPAEPSQSGGNPGLGLAALAEVLGLNQGESNVPVCKPQNMATQPLAQGLLGQLQQQQQHRQQQQMTYNTLHHGSPLGNSAYSGGTPPPRSNLGLGSGGGYAVNSTAGAVSGGGLALIMPGSASVGRQSSSLRNRRGLPDLPVHRPGAKAGSQPLSPLSGSATPSPRSGKRLANAPLQPGLGWPLSPASKSPRADGQMSPAGCTVSLPNGHKYPQSPTTSLLGDMSKLTVHRPQTPPGSSLSADALMGGVKAETGLLTQSASEGEKHLDGGGEGGDVLFDVGGDDFGEGEGGHSDEKQGGGSPGEGNAGSGPNAGRPKHSTKPRSVAERLRRERIAVRLQRLKEVMPKTDARIDTSAMLEDAVVYIRSLQSRCRALEKQNEMLTAQVARLSQQQQNGASLLTSQISQMMRPMGQ